MTTHGRIKLYIGPMFSGKTQSMCRDVETYNIAKKTCAIVQYVEDTRYDDLAKHRGLVSHAGDEYHNVPIIKTGHLGEVYDVLVGFDVIGVDEAQFFSDAPEVLQQLANSGKIIICSGLDADSFGKPFLRMPELIALAEDVTKLKGVCTTCYAKASFTIRTSDSTQVVEIGGLEKYRAACRKCMFTNNRAT